MSHRTRPSVDTWFRHVRMRVRRSFCGYFFLLWGSLGEWDTLKVPLVMLAAMDRPAAGGAWCKHVGSRLLAYSAHLFCMLFSADLGESISITRLYRLVG